MKRDKLIRVVIATVVICCCSMLSVVASPLGSVKDFTSNDKEVTINSEKGRILITPFTNNIIKVTTFPANSTMKAAASKSVVLNPDVKFTTVDNGGHIIIVAGKTEVLISKATSIITFKNGNKLMLEESEGIVRDGNETCVSFKSNSNESFYGTGERGHSYNLKGDTLIMFNKQNYGYEKGERAKQMNITIPFYISSLGYGVLFDDYTSSKLILNNPVEYITNNRNAVSYYYIGGDKATIADVVNNYTLLTGRQELAPFWSLGYITSKYGYKTQAETTGVIETLRREGYPVDGIVLDLYWYGKEDNMGRYDWNKQQWPDHKKMLADLRADGVKMITISQPYINKTGAAENYNMASKGGMLATDSLGNTHDVETWVGIAGMLDTSSPATREWMWSRYREFTNDGVEGHWGDLGEPETHPLTMRHANGETAAEYHNLYGNDWSEIIYDGFKKDFPDKRLMQLMRGGTAGLQRFSVFPWSTDVSRSWGGLQAQVPIMLNTALSGLGYMSHDIGGFAVDKANPTDDELYARWLELGLFTPTFRTHSTVAAEPYHYKKPGYQDLLKNIVKTRYQWLPYNYTLAYENATTGAPFVRPLNFDDSSNSQLSNIDDQYMWGSEVMVAPVLQKGALGRDIIFPEGKWIDMNMPQNTYVGPEKVAYAAPVPVLPIFVKAGAFVPMANYAMKSTEEYNPANYTVKYFPNGTKSSYTLFDDNRVSTTTLAKKEYQLINFTGDDSTKSTIITLDAQGKYAGMPALRDITFEIPAWNSHPVDIKINGKALKAATSLESVGVNGYYYDKAKNILYVKLSWNYIPTTIKIAK